MLALENKGQLIDGLIKLAEQMQIETKEKASSGEISNTKTALLNINPAEFEKDDD